MAVLMRVRTTAAAVLFLAVLPLFAAIQSVQAADVMVFAAASLKNALDDAAHV